MSEMVVKAEDAAIAGEEMAELLECCCGVGIFFGARGREFRQGDCGEIRRL